MVQSTNADGADATPALSPEALKQGAAESRRLSAALGEVVSVLLRSSQLHTYKVVDLKWHVLPALETRQALVIRAQSKQTGRMDPIGVLLWAHVSAAVDKRLRANIGQPIRLQPKEWTSGDILWLVDAFGDRRAINETLKRVINKDFKGQTMYARVNTREGKYAVREIRGADVTKS